MAENNECEVNSDNVCQLIDDQKALEATQISIAASVAAINDYLEPGTGTFVFAADTGEPNASQTALAAVVDAIDPDHVFLGGGNAYTGDTIANNLAWTQTAIDDAQVWPAWGVPDWTDFTLTDVIAFFPYLPATFGSQRYYHQHFKDQGDLELFSIISDPTEPNGIAVDSTQYTQIKNAVEGSTARRKVAMFYHPPFTPVDAAVDATQYSSVMKTWEPILQQCDLVLTGQNSLTWVASWGAMTVVNCSATTQAFGALDANQNITGVNLGEAGMLFCDDMHRYFTKITSSKFGLRVELVRYLTIPGASPLIDFSLLIP